LFRHLLLQIGGANIENPPPSSLAEERQVRSLVVQDSGAPAWLRAAARDSPTLAAIFVGRSLAARQLIH
jgi:hypothetical protein